VTPIDQMTLTQWISFAAFIWLGVVQSTFVIWWWLTVRWWPSFTGRAFFSAAATLAVTADVVVAGRFLDWAYEDEIKAAIYWAVALTATFQLIAFGFKRRAMKQEMALASYRDGKHVV
jgi:hypothetical protein